MPTTTIEGLDGVRQALQNTPKEARAVLRDVIRTTIRVVTQRTRQAAPFETGALRQAIADGKVSSGSTAVNGGVVIQPGEFRGRTPSRYVMPLEYGKGKGARPFIRSTAEAEAGRFVAQVKAAGKTLEENLEARGGRFV